MYIRFIQHKNHVPLRDNPCICVRVITAHNNFNPVSCTNLTTKETKTNSSQRPGDFWLVKIHMFNRYVYVCIEKEIKDKDKTTLISQKKSRTELIIIIVICTFCMVTTRLEN